MCQNFLGLTVDATFAGEMLNLPLAQGAPRGDGDVGDGSLCHHIRASSAPSAFAASPPQHALALLLEASLRASATYEAATSHLVRMVPLIARHIDGSRVGREGYGQHQPCRACGRAEWAEQAA